MKNFFDDEIFDFSNSLLEELGEFYKMDLIHYLETTYNCTIAANAAEVQDWKRWIGQDFDHAMVFKKTTRGKEVVITVFYNENRFKIVLNRNGYNGPCGYEFDINRAYNELVNDENIIKIYINKVDMSDENTMIDGLADFFNHLKNTNIIGDYRPNYFYKYKVWKKSTIAKTLANVISKENYVESLDFKI